jgi:cleavage stimulation factor subunit 3
MLSWILLMDCGIMLDARALFERVISNFPPERARPLWERWARYEYQYGDLDAALKLEKRMAEVYVSGAIFLLSGVRARS